MTRCLAAAVAVVGHALGLVPQRSRSNVAAFADRRVHKPQDLKNESRVTPSPLLGLLGLQSFLTAGDKRRRSALRPSLLHLQPIAAQVDSGGASFVHDYLQRSRLLDLRVSLCSNLGKFMSPLVV